MTDEEKEGGTPLTLPSKEVGREPREEAEARIYEVGYLLLPTVTEEELPREVTSLKDVLDKEKAVIISEEFPRLRPLAYPMQKRVAGGYRKYREGYFGWVKFEAAAESATRVEAEFKRNEKVLRYMLIKTVREQTITMGRPRMARPERREAPKDAAPSAPVSEVELDKSIEKLIAE